MIRYRCLIQDREGKDTHIEHISFETDDIKSVISKIRETLSDEIEDRRKLFLLWLHSRQPDYYDKIMKEFEEDLIDWNSKGKDISRKEFLKNELWGEANL